jgi:quercetin dioxygenase-like cupin family protein
MLSSKVVLLSAALVALCEPEIFAREPLDPTQALQITPAEFDWVQNPELHGLVSAVLAGDPSRPGPYVMRVKIPANAKLAPHFHPDEVRMVTVLSGTLYFAFGDKFEEPKLKAFGPGSFFTEPKNRPHFALTKTDDVMLQINAVGPTGTTSVQPSKASR